MPESPLNLRIHVDAENAIRYLGEMKDRSEDFTAPLKWAKREMGLMNGKNFAKNGLPSGQRWAPLDREYAAWKLEGGRVGVSGRGVRGTAGAGAMLVLSKKLFNSLRNLNGPANIIRNTHAEFGTHIEYAKFHQYGTSKMPKRQIVYEPKGFAKMLAKVCATHIVEGRLGVTTGALFS